MKRGFLKRPVLLLFIGFFVMTLVISVSLADYGNTNYGVVAGGRRFAYGNLIGENRRTGYAQTNGGPNTYNYVYVTFYWVNNLSGQTGGLWEERSGSIFAKIEASELTGYNYYYKAVSNHSGSFDGAQFSVSNVTTITN